jgi:hypothetical protein
MLALIVGKKMKKNSFREFGGGQDIHLYGGWLAFFCRGKDAVIRTYLTLKGSQCRP